jgi:hypothetical protein
VQPYYGKTVLFQAALAVILVSLTHCQKKDESPPPPKVSGSPSASDKASASGILTAVQGEGSTDCCEIVPNSDLKGRMGRLIVQFPKDADAGNTRVEIFHPIEQKALKGGYGNQTIELLPGLYDVDISKKRLTSVPVKSGNDTRVKVGVLHVSAGKETRIDVLDAGKKLTGWYGDQAVGLPPGAFHVQVAGQAEQVKIEDGKVTEF